MHKSATKCNETIGKWCKNKHGASKIIDTLETYQASSHIGGTAKAWAVPPWCVGPLWPPSNSSSDLWKLPGIIRLQELVSSNSENISCVAFLKHKNSKKTGNWHCGDLLIG
jgi:hypothetical protein